MEYHYYVNLIAFWRRISIIHGSLANLCIEPSLLLVAKGDKNLFFRERLVEETDGNMKQPRLIPPTIPKESRLVELVRYF